MTEVKKCECDFDSQYAYCVKNIEDDPIKKITIIDYLTDNKLQTQVKEKKLFLVCEEKNELIKYKSDKKRSHFKHKIDELNNPMSEWHKEWQSNFEKTEIAIGNRYADAVVGNVVLEFQNSIIDQDLVDARNENYTKYKKELYWIINCNKYVIFNKIYDDLYLITFESNGIWKYDKFVNSKHIYLNIDNRVFKIEPKKVKSNMIYVKEYKMKNDFISSIKKNINIWSSNIEIQCILYHNQRGAGCGKTYESIQLLANDKFNHKKTFIYLTKMHSAREVIYKELCDQYNRNDLDNLELFDNTQLSKTDKDEEEKQEKHYKIRYKNKKTNNECIIIIGTIDSFMYAIGNKETKSSDFFAGIVKSVKDGYTSINENGVIRYAKNNTKLNKESLIIIDEAQDLGPEYIEAINTIMIKTDIDTYVIGDKLQSIWDENNIHTFLEKNDLPHIIIKRDTGSNQVKRFHNIKFKDFVNTVINFKTYGLPQIEKVCEKDKCKYKHENNIIPYNLFEIPITKNIDIVDKNDICDKIINIMNKEIEKYKYLPENFMFIFPILSRNELANGLESKLQDFWIQKFNDDKYQKEVLDLNDHWKDKYKINEYHKYVYLHKSNEGKSINLKESENATRILSIHASKGNGCEVVFVLGITESTLTIFSNKKYDKKKNNIIYESLLHVAITRQKKSLYMSIENNGDEIYNRFKKFNIEKDINIQASINETKIYSMGNGLIEYALTKEYEIINNSFIENKGYMDKIFESNESKTIIDMSHHVIRNSIFEFNILSNIIEKEKIEDTDNGNKKDQTITVLNKIAGLKIKQYLYKEYYKKLKEIYDNNKKRIENFEMPILKFQTTDQTRYYKYTCIIQEYIEHIQNKIKYSLKNKRMPLLCPLESVFIMYMIDIYMDGQYSDITIMELYSIIYCYDECSNELNEEHNKYKCLCTTKFKDNNNKTSYNDIRESIKKHHEKTKQINDIYTNYKEYISEKYKDTIFTYNIHHKVLFGEPSNNIKILNKYTIIAYSDNCVINIILKTQFNLLNFYDVMFNAIFGQFMIMNPIPETENYKRYNDKKVITCIMSLDSSKPIFYEFDIDKEDANIKQCIKKYLLDKYSNSHNSIYDFYNNTIIKSKPANINSLTYMYIELQKDKYMNMPQYIKEYYRDIDKEINNLDKNNIDYIKNRTEILKKVTIKELFHIKLNESLEDVINKYLKIHNVKEIDNNF